MSDRGQTIRVNQLRLKCRFFYSCIAPLDEQCQLSGHSLDQLLLFLQKHPGVQIGCLLEVDDFHRASSLPLDDDISRLKVVGPPEAGRRVGLIVEGYSGFGIVRVLPGGRQQRHNTLKLLSNVLTGLLNHLGDAVQASQLFDAFPQGGLRQPIGHSQSQCLRHGFARLHCLRIEGVGLLALDVQQADNLLVCIETGHYERTMVPADAKSLGGLLSARRIVNAQRLPRVTDVNTSVAREEREIRIVLLTSDCAAQPLQVRILVR